LNLFIKQLEHTKSNNHQGRPIRSIVTNFLLEFEPDLEDTPMNALREGKQWALVTQLARQYGEQGARTLGALFIL